MDAHPRISIFMDAHPRNSVFMEQQVLPSQDRDRPIQEILGHGAFPGNPQEHGQSGLASFPAHSPLIQELKPGLGLK